MILSLHTQARLFLVTILLGGGLGMLYDGLRIFRQMVRHSRLWVQAEDGLFWFLAVFLVFSVMLQASSGEIRFFSIFGLFGGMGLYWLILSPVIMAVGVRGVRLAKMIILLFFRIIFTPFYLFFWPFRKPLQKIRGFCGKRGKKLLHSCRVYVKMKTHVLYISWKICRRKEK